VAHDISVGTSRFLGLREPWNSLFIVITASRFALTCWLDSALGILVNRLIGLRDDNRGQQGLGRIPAECPYFLTKEVSKCQMA
jgi:hypothetical protein